MSESAGYTIMPANAHAPPQAPTNARIRLTSSNDSPTRRNPTTNTPSQILLESLQNFVIPLINAADGQVKEVISQADLSLEAGKLVVALQEFISSLIVQARVSQLQKIEVDLKAPDVDDVAEDAEVEFPGTAPQAIYTYTINSQKKSSLQVSGLKARYERFMGRVQEVVREHIFRNMPIRVLHFTDIPRGSGTKLQITLLDKNGVYDRVMEDIRAKYSQSMFDRKVSDTWSLGGDVYERIKQEIIKELVSENTGYAILSHTWLRGSDSEVTYGTWQTGQIDTQQAGYQKLAKFCKSAWKDHGLSFGWMDTICINKDSSSELDESIRSMYKWYKSSAICITYLGKTPSLHDIHQDPWFTRGWTFQELLAPANMTFYNKDWKKFILYTNKGDKHNEDICDQITKATTITLNELQLDSHHLPVSRKMQLAARRNVTREEDIAYSLMGICNVSISTAYGEGEQRAFFRLMTEILNTSPEVFDMFNCAQPRPHMGVFSIIPSGPSAYLHCSEDIQVMRLKPSPPVEPLLLTHVGLRMPILLMPSLREDDPNVECDSIGDYYAIVHLPATRPEDVGFYCLLDKGIETSTAEKGKMFGILNFTAGDTTNISVPDHCLAVCFNWSRQPEPGMEWDSILLAEQRIDTKVPIVFQLGNQKGPISGNDIKRSELGKHGMSLMTMHGLNILNNTKFESQFCINRAEFEGTQGSVFEMLLASSMITGRLSN